MLNISFLAFKNGELWDLTVCIAVNGEKFQSHTMTLALVRRCPISNLSELFSYTTCSICLIYFKWIEPLLFELSCSQTERQ